MDDLTIDIVEYERQTFGASWRKQTERMTDTSAYYYVGTWAETPGHVAVRSSIRVTSEPYSEPECGALACRHCPKRWYYRWYVTWQGFIGVKPEHERACRTFGEANVVVRCPVFRPIPVSLNPS